MSKIGRNDPCPCGSGKKYKNCHLNVGNLPVAAPARQSFSQLLETYNAKQLISFTAALQLNPANHGRNVRFENLSRQILLRFDPNDTKPLATWDAVKEVLENYKEDAWLEDPLTNHFTEIAIFEEGNYIVYPGLYVGFTEVLNQLTECIFLHRHGLPELPIGKKWISKDDLDELLSLTNQLTEWGAMSESMRMNIDDPKMGLLPSGRIGTEKTLQREAFEPYAVAKTESEIYRNIESFESNYLPERAVTTPVETTESKLLDAAFLAEFNIKLLDLAHIAGA